jgi:hypothetical protein
MKACFGCMPESFALLRSCVDRRLEIQALAANRRDESPANRQQLPAKRHNPNATFPHLSAVWKIPHVSHRLLVSGPFRQPLDSRPTRRRHPD